MKKEIHREWYECDYCGREVNGRDNIYDECLFSSIRKVVDICCEECLNKHFSVIRNKLENDLEFKNMIVENIRYFLKETIKENDIEKIIEGYKKLYIKNL